MASKLFNLEMFYQMGMDPQTGLPLKFSDYKGETLLIEAKRALRIKDEQDFIHRYKWQGLPDGLTAELIERILYYKGQGMLFRLSDDGQFFFLPYCVSGPFDCYGRPNKVRPVIFGGSPSTKSNGEIKSDEKIFLDVYFNPIMDVNEEVTGNPCVILKDYTPQLSDYIIPRTVLQEHLISLEAEALPLARTSRIANCGVRGMRVNDEGASNNVRMANDAIRKAAVTGNVFVPVVDELEFQELGVESKETPEGTLMYMQALDNLRRSFLGVENGGVYEKKAHTLESEESVNESSTESVAQDGLRQREIFAEIANHVWGLSMKPALQDDADDDYPQSKDEEVKEDAE